VKPFDVVEDVRPRLGTGAILTPVCSQYSSATPDELIGAVEAVGHAASRQVFRQTDNSQGRAGKLSNINLDEY
jgi:hypothetical protein